MSFDPRAFKIGFWHPFGSHADESAEDIIIRKRREIERQGWTLWSFQFRNALGLWSNEIRKVNPRHVPVFCSEGKGARDPKGERKYCTYYKFVGEVAPSAIPHEITIPHPMGDRTKGSAFIVGNIIHPVSYEAISIEWLKDGQWQNSPLPTRPEYLIRPGNRHPLRRFRAILELQAPYLAEVGV